MLLYLTNLTLNNPETEELQQAPLCHIRMSVFEFTIIKVSMETDLGAWYCIDFIFPYTNTGTITCWFDDFHCEALIALTFKPHVTN